MRDRIAKRICADQFHRHQSLEIHRRAGPWSATCDESERIADAVLDELGWDTAPTTRIAHGPDEDQDVAALAYLLAGTFGQYLPKGTYRLIREGDDGHD